MSALDKTLSLLSTSPEMGTLTRRHRVRALALPRYPYRIFYRLNFDEIEVLHIRHTSRRPWLN